AGIVCSHCTTTGREWESTNVYSNPISLELLFGFTNPRDFRVSIDNRWDQVIVHLRLMASDTLGNHHALFRGFVREHCATNHVTNGVYAWNAGFALVVDEDKATLIHINAAVSCQQISSHRTTADRY